MTLIRALQSLYRISWVASASPALPLSRALKMPSTEDIQPIEEGQDEGKFYLNTAKTSV